MHVPSPGDIPSTEQLLVEGGDARIALEPDDVLNKYGCQPFPDPDLAAFGSSTASVISAESFAAADQLRHRIFLTAGVEPEAVTYTRELDLIRRELLRLCGVSDLAGIEVVFASSGTDLHLIAAQLAGGTESMPTLVVMVDAAETGSHVPAALAGRHFSSRASLGDSVIEGTSISNSGAIEVVTVPIRREDGTPRAAADVDADFESLVSGAAATGRRVILVLVDVSKTGLIAPSSACVSRLQRRLPEILDVLVDACQFRISPSTLLAYLEHDFMVALTGSKFVTGPTFSGALLIPPAVALRLRKRPFPPALGAYSTQGDWPQGWDTAGCLDNVANFGLLLRWEAALEELRAFRSVPEAEITAFLKTFASAIQERLTHDPVFEPLPVSELDRRPLIKTASWDSIPTIFPFLLLHPDTHAGMKHLNHEETAQVYRLLQIDLTHHPASEHAGITGDSARLRCQLGQPVACGNRDGVLVSALRLCISSRLIVEATSQGGRNTAIIIARAKAALDKTALLVTKNVFKNETIGSQVSEDTSESHYLGQFIPLHYHHHMLMDKNRMGSFKAAIAHTVFEGAKVLELGGGTGVLSCFAASKARKVWCVEFNPDLVVESRRLLARNPDGHKVEVVHADAFHYLPPEPVDVVICEMIHSAMLREKQVAVINAFKDRYRRRFGGPLPVFVPEAVIMAVQPLQQTYDFFGFHAPIVQFQSPHAIQPDTLEMAAPVVYSTLDFTLPTSPDIQWVGTFSMERDGTVNALRFVTKNILAVVPEQATTIDWLGGHLVLPLAEALEVKAGNVIQVSFRYFAGGSLRSLEKNMRATVLDSE
ncbi:methyltransferase domain-containing protein [Sulfuricella sp. T08]|uniref:methyltransferase domain-containing protein n=1 Tax=Sulfuricella sp. T08 TaxID=1632857 RepID=UPI001ED9BA19|nr:methyltransferase domain-containing protein [Sulfuricella sp. T08]